MHPKPPSVWLTRPEGQDNGWTEALCAAGWDAHTIPSLRLQAFELPQSETPTATHHFDALMFVSQAAVQYFFARTQAPRKEKLRFWCTGPGTRRALLEYGVPEAQIDSPAAGAAMWDSETLWRQVKEQVAMNAMCDKPYSVLLLRGADPLGRPAGRSWLQEQLLSAGASVETLCVYQRIPLEQTARAGVWILTSSFALEALTGSGWETCDAIATHERIAQAARTKGFRRVGVCKPEVSALLACLESQYGS